MSGFSKRYYLRQPSKSLSEWNQRYRVLENEMQILTIEELEVALFEKTNAGYFMVQQVGRNRPSPPQGIQ